MTPHPNTTLPHILVVDDTPQNLQVIAEILSHNIPCDLSFATDGHHALDAVNADRPDLILLDVMMPGMSGFEVCDRLKHTPETNTIPIIFLTAKTETSDIATGFKLGASDYVTKPFNATELVARIKTHLDIRRTNLLLADKNEELRRMLHILCHDLANPIGSILSLLDLMDEKRPPDPDTIALIRETTTSALDIIALVRQMRAIEDGKIRFTLQPVSLLKACRDAQSILQARLAEKRIRLELHVPENLTVAAEPTALTHTVLCNLITNAAKFSEPESTVLLEAHAEPNGLVRCTLSDTGIGIPPDMLRKLFDPTMQTSRPGTRGEAGTGFGMPLVKQIIESFGGTIEIDSRDRESSPGNHGTRISLCLQAADSPCIVAK